MNKIFISIIAIMFVLTLAMPLYAQTDTTGTTPTDQTVTAPTTTATPPPPPPKAIKDRWQAAQEKAKNIRGEAKDKIKDLRQEQKTQVKQENQQMIITLAFCVGAAVDNRETALMTALVAYTAAVKTALQTRKDALKAAWTLTDAKAIKAAVKAAWTKFKQDHKIALEAKRKAVKLAWTTFEAERKVCGGIGKVTPVEEGGQGADAQL